MLTYSIITYLEILTYVSKNDAYHICLTSAYKNSKNYDNLGELMSDSLNSLLTH